MHRLVAYAHNGVQRFNVDRDEMVIGSDTGCDIHLPFAGVGRRHARLSSGGGRMEIEDLGSRKGLLVNGEKVRRARLEVLDEIRLGSIALLLEDVTPGVRPAAEPAAPAQLEPTITPSRMLEHLAGISRWVLSDSASSITLESLVDDLLEEFGGGVLFLFQGEPETRGIKFVVASEARWLGHGEQLLLQVTPELDAGNAFGEALASGAAAHPGSAAHSGSTTPPGAATPSGSTTQPGSTTPSGSMSEEGSFVGELEGGEAWIAYRALSALDRPYLLVVALPRFRPESGPDGWSPASALRTLSDQLILGLVHHVGQYEPLLFGRSAQRDLTLAPGLITGESPAMKRVVAELRGAVDQGVPVLLRGEVGVSKERLARSLHLSGSRAERPFVVASCGGAAPRQIEADLFGAEVPGKSGPVEREGKLLEADGGTIYLEDVDELPLDLQHRLTRFLRSGQVEPVDSRTSRAVDVRLIVSSRRPLEEGVARDDFRLDLAYRLSQYVVEVPALRDRREDLPLLIQAAVNRCCHQTGKRIQGITVKAMESLAKHDYPGNLPELEAVVRRLVYLCPSGRPIDDAMLPEEVRLSKIKGLRPDVSSELHLERLVADTERAAIREALHRTGGNKSEAARQLGLSRNGLNMKMSRLGLHV